MYLSVPVLLASLAAIASAAPVTPVPTSPLQKRAGYCGNSSFENASSGGSPLISDCQTLANNIAGSSDWYAYPYHRQLASYGTCVFGATADLPFTRVGNDDIRDLIRDSIARFSWQGKVGAAGTMKCEGENTPVRWGLYHT